VVTSLAGAPLERRLQCLSQSTLTPAMGATCGRREREADASNEEAQSSHVLVVATVEGTPIHGMPVAFAGSRRNVGLGRSVVSVAGLVPMQMHAPTTTGVLWRNEEGNVVSMRQAHALVASMPNKHRCGPRTRPSLNPETRASHTPLSGAVVSVSRSGKPAQAGGTGTGVGTNGRCAARRSSPLLNLVKANSRRSCVTSSEKEGGHGHRPCEETRVPERCPYVVFRCRSRQAASWPRISSHAALQKEWRYE